MDTLFTSYFAHFTQADYTQLKDRLNPGLDNIRKEIRQALEDNKRYLNTWSRLSNGWKYTEEWLGSEERFPEVDTYENLKSNTGRKILYAKPELPVHVQSYTKTFLGDGTPIPVWNGTSAKDSVTRIEEMLIIQKAGDDKPSLREHKAGDQWKKSLPWNWLNLNRGLLADFDPMPDAHQSLRILSELLNGVKPWVSPSEFHFGKPSTDGDILACLKFLILGEKGTFSGNHVDVLAGTWILALDGTKLWWVFTGDFGPEQKDTFGEQGSDWNPGAGPGAMQVLPLEPGDYLLMMPGHICPHAPFSMHDCLMTGGMFWNDSILPQVLDNLAWICSRNGIVSNEAIPRQLMEIFELMRTHEDFTTRPEVMAALDRAELILRPLLSCGCGPGICIKGSSCICEEGMVKTRDGNGNSVDGPWYRDSGCTLWCKCNCKKAGHESEKTEDETESIPAGSLRYGRTRGNGEGGEPLKQGEKKLVLLNKLAGLYNYGRILSDLQ